MELFELEPRAILGLFGSHEQLQTGALALGLGFRILSRFDSGAHEGLVSFPVVFGLFWGGLRPFSFSGPCWKPRTLP